MGRPVIHFEIGCRDSKKTQEFYTKMFGWTITEAGPAAMIAPEAPGIGGHITALGHEPYHCTTFYVDVEDVAAYLKKAESLGGKTLVPRSTSPPARSPGCRTPKATLWACGSLRANLPIARHG
jgi:predicted enzyme related to lactoylglutathione lyase